MNTIVSRSWKAVIAALAIIAGSMTALAANPDVTSVLPATATGWLTTAATVIGGTWLVWLKKNEVTVEQAEKLLEDARDRAGL